MAWFEGHGDIFGRAVDFQFVLELFADSRTLYKFSGMEHTYPIQALKVVGVLIVDRTLADGLGCLM